MLNGLIKKHASQSDLLNTTSNFFFFFSELCWGKAMAAFTKARQSKKEESERLKGERDQIKFIDLRFERWQVVRFRKARRILGTNL